MLEIPVKEKLKDDLQEKRIDQRPDPVAHERQRYRDQAGDDYGNHVDDSFGLEIQVDCQPGSLHGIDGAEEELRSAEDHYLAELVLMVEIRDQPRACTQEQAEEQGQGNIGDKGRGVIHLGPFLVPDKGVGEARVHEGGRDCSEHSSHRDQSEIARIQKPCQDDALDEVETLDGELCRRRPDHSLERLLL